MSDLTLIQALPPEVRGAYQQSCEGMTPTGMRLDFGLVDLTRATDDDEVEEPGTFEPQTDIGRAARKLAIDAMQGWEGIHRTHWSSMADSTVDKRAAFLRSAQHAKSAIARIDAAHDALVSRITERAGELATVLGNASKPPTSMGEVQIDAEVRTMIRTESDPAKAMEIAAAHPRAVATLPAGIAKAIVGESGYKAMRRTYLQAVAPDAWAESMEAQRALDVISKAQTQLTKRARKMIDFNMADQMAKHANWKPFDATAAA